MNTQSYKIKLEEEKNLLESELTNIGVFNKKTNQWEVVPEAQENGPEADSNDLADRSEDYEERGATLLSLNSRLTKVKKSLEQIKKGNYGKCEKCGAEIEEDRLEANPAAHTCKACM